MLRRRIKWLMGILLMLALMRWPEAMLEGIQKAMHAWYYSVAPALFPFMALLPLLTCRESMEVWERMMGRFMGKIFNLPGAGAPAAIIGMLAGSPAGAQAALRIASESGLNRGQLFRIVVSACGLSPAFLVAGVGSAMLHNAGDGALLLCSQMCAQMTMLFLMRNIWSDRKERVSAETEFSAESPVRAAVFSIITVCGYMALFSGIACMLSRLCGNGFGNILLCLLDLPSGAAMVSSIYMKRTTRLLLLSAMMGFGGACIGAQNLAALRGLGLKPGVYFSLKGLSAAISTAFMALQLRLNMDIPITNSPKVYACALLCAVIIGIPAIFSLKKSIS